MEKKKKWGRQDLRARRALTGYLFISPFIIGFLAFMVKPLLESFVMSFCDVKIQTGQGGFVMKSVGFANYIKAFTIDPEFNRLLAEELTGMLVDVPAILIFSLFVAMLLNQRFAGRGFVRAIFFLPVILSSGVIVGLEYNNTLLQGMESLIRESNGSNITSVLEEILVTGSMGSKFMKIVFDIVNHVYDIAIASGIQIVIFLSGLQTVTASMYEAAKIEGCTSWECFWKITLPMVSSLILVNLVYTVIDFFIKSDNLVMTKISDTMIPKMDYGFSAAMAWIYFGAVIVIIAVFASVISRRVYYYE